MINKTVSIRKKILFGILGIILFIIGVIWYGISYYIYSLVKSYSIETISDITGISSNMLGWLLFSSLPISLTLFFIFIGIIFIAILFYRKRKNIND